MRKDVSFFSTKVAKRGNRADSHKLPMDARISGVIHTLIASIFMGVAFLQLGLAFDSLLTGRNTVMGALLLLGTVAVLYVVFKLRENAIASYRIEPVRERVEPTLVPINSLPARRIDHA